MCGACASGVSAKLLALVAEIVLHRERGATYAPLARDGQGVWPRNTLREALTSPGSSPTSGAGSRHLAALRAEQVVPAPGRAGLG